MANERQESKLGDGSGCIDGGRVGREVSQVFYTLFSKIDKMKTRKTKDLPILT